MSWFTRQQLAVAFAIVLATSSSAQVAVPDRFVPAQPLQGRAAELVKLADVAGGCVLVVGADAELATSLASTGRWLVHVVDTDAAKIKALREKFSAEGVYGLGTAEVRSDFKALPLRDEIANAVVADLDAKNPPALKEVLRVLQPQGVAWVKLNGAWRFERKPVPKGYGSWTHDYGNASNNPVSNDTVADLPRGMQWLAGFKNERDNEPVIEGNSLIDYQSPSSKLKNADGTESGGRKGPEMTRSLLVRDAFNGLPRVSMPVAPRLQQVRPIVSGGRFYWFADNDQPMRSANTTDGGDVLEYKEGLSWWKIGNWREFSKTYPAASPNTGGMIVAVAAAVHDGVLYQSGGQSVVALDAKTGRRLWKYDTKLPYVSGVAVGHDNNVYAVEANLPKMSMRYYGNRQAQNIIALDARTGALRWSSPAPENQTGQLTAAPGRLIVVASGHHTWNTDVGYVASFDAATGKKQWQSGFYSGGAQMEVTHITVDKRDTTRPNSDPSGANGIVLGDYFLMHGSYCMSRFRLSDGKLEGIQLQGNQGCQRLYGFADNSIMTFVSPLRVWGLADANFENVRWQQSGYIHPICASGMPAANGKLYVKPNTMCDCNYHLRSFQCFAPTPAGEATTDDQRLDKGYDGAAPAVFNAAYDRFLQREWTSGSYSEFGTLSKYAALPIRLTERGEAPALEVGAVRYVPIAHLHALEARRGDALLWRFLAGGRIMHAPVLNDGRLYLASRDGYLYCLDAATGKLHWRFLAAKCDQRIVNSGQLESIWPALNPVLHEGLVWVAAGLVVDLDDGVFIWGLDPVSGAIKKRARLLNQLAVGEKGASRNAKIAVTVGGAFAHTRGGGFAVHALNVVNNQLAIGYRREKNFGSHPDSAWVWAPIDTNNPAPQPVSKLSPNLQLDVDTPTKPVSPGK